MDQEHQAELLIRLDERVRAEQARVNYHLGYLAHRITQLEQRPLHQVLSNWGWFKIMLALAITMGVWLGTGDPRAALRAAAGAAGAMQ